ncbi:MULTISPECIES: conjugal transfer protein TraG N-terminal domain-containing protein [unclassified Novosphingobium]|uniref:conjugal transfer protein TraG N-terminal domain-containing protein n=1 Tax=unclassified Novosphingobium TaxID=2644732 RepID=UPI000D31D2F9|nr:MULTISPECIES: conjugal transfer protein TraG N-terminal domain-containing protein [unclassified Novosphingobium]PTR12616.1 conjugal transfer mating pair stabilization protein TraG [Novosphingobium sp. GV055]PUB06400.1 conjugal transfer mating pair stabilization protein TraG [Novosphingobium sp. GV061]PUB22451.1 conjugal transfer mating pair stabilization protein TraG [Novosphingobium sp. GV079]PUB44476.1 conjugal transfer mating pair stabilization protein TraG [Novosphingobium sp. GV027]
MRLPFSRLFRSDRSLAALLLAAPLALGATPALAVDTSYYTYDGFAETVDAFHLVALIFADPRYETLVVICAVAGIALGALLASVRGQGMGLVAFGFQMLVGIGLFVGLVSTTGTVHVYDKVRNAYQPVGGVPNLIVVVAGTTNLMERALSEVIDDNTTDPNAKLEFGAGGHAFDLFLNAVSPRGPMTDTFLDATIKDYVRQCYPVARTSGAYNVDDDQLFHTSTDLPATFAAMAGPATYSTVYTSADKAGTTMSCSDAWSAIQTRLSDSTLFDDYAKQVCQRTGYDVTDVNQLTRCKSQLWNMGDMMMGTPLTMPAFMTDVMLGNAVGDVLFEDSPATASRVMANRAVISSGLTTMSVANEWMPTIRATVFGIMLFMTPIALLFILTPINLRVASFTFGLFVFVALWGVIDAGIYQLTHGRAMDVLAEMRSNHVAANAWMLAPSSAMKALAIFGSFRTAAAGLAGAFVFTVFRLSGNVFTAFTGEALQAQGLGTAAAAPLMTKEGYASALESQASAAGTMARSGASSSFGDFGERSNFGANRGFGMAGTVIGEHGNGLVGGAAFALGGIDALRELGGLAPALAGRDLSNPAVAQAVRANAATGAIHNFAEKDALRSLGTGYFGQGQAGERAFAAFSQNMVQWKAFGDTRAYDMMQSGAQRHFERTGYDVKDAALKASTVIAQASADPTFAKLSANAFDQEQMLRNDITGAEVQVGAMEGRRDFASSHVAATERGNVATEQAWRTGSNAGQRHAAAMLGLSLGETSRRISFINGLSGEARSSAVTQLSRATGRNEAQVMHALETYNAATQLGTADGATAEAAREHTGVYSRTREAAGYDFAERSGKLDAQREVGTAGTRSSARIGEERRQADNAGFAQGAAAAGVSVREAARLDSFMQALTRTAGNQTDMAEGGVGGVTDRARNERLGRIVDNERLTRMQKLLADHGVNLTKRQIAMDQNGDLNLNLTPETAAALWKGGLINESQLGAVANGGRARFSFAHNDLLVSSSTGYSQSARSDTSTRFEAGKQAGPDTVEHFLGDGQQGQAMMANWLKGGFEMDRKGQWRLKPQVADTLTRDVQAIVAQTGWQRSLSRSAQDQTSMGTDINAGISASAGRGGGGSASKSGGGSVGAGISGGIGFTSTDRGITTENAEASMDIVNYDVRNAIAAAERKAAHSHDPVQTFTQELHNQILGQDGLRNRYLDQADSGRGTFDITGPLTSIEQSSVLKSGRFSIDPDHGSGDSDSSFKDRRDK